MGEMFSEREWLAFGIAILFVLLMVVTAAFLIEIVTIAARNFINKKRDEKDAGSDEIFAVVDDDDFYEIADAALEAQSLIDFKCKMQGIDKAIRILKGDEE